MCEFQKRIFLLLFNNERALFYAIGQLRVHSLTSSMSVPSQASKEGSSPPTGKSGILLNLRILKLIISILRNFASFHSI